MIKPAPLKPNDTVAIIAPSSPVAMDKVKTAIDSIEFLGLNPIPFKSCYMEEGYLAGSDSQRAEDVNTAFLDSAIKGIFCLRGGYGATRILPLLDYEGISKNNKVFVGYSDITALHTVINKFCGFITYHGPMPSTEYQRLDDFTMSSMIASIFNGFDTGEIENPPHEPFKLIHSGKGSGVLTGGNLSVIASTLGSSYDIDTKEKILFLEEVDEPLYKIDRGLTALKLAGKLEGVKGLLLGTFTHDSYDRRDSQYARSLLKIFYEMFQPYNIPVIGNVMCGHSYPQMILPLGMMVEILADDSKIPPTISLHV